MGSFQERYQQQIEKLARDLRNETLPVLTEELFALFERNGNRLQYEEVYFKRRKFLAVYGMAAYLFGKPEDVEKLEEVLLEICSEECWALPAHVNRKTDENWKVTVDLFAAETAQALAEIVTLVNEERKPAEHKNRQKLSESLVQKVKQEIEKRVLIPFEQTTYHWERADHNWNAVCGGSIGSAAIYLLEGKEEKRLEAIIQRICHSLTFYLNGFQEDGACMEGIGYYTYGMTYFTGFAEQLLRYSKGNINLFANEKVRRIAEFQQKMYFQCGQTVSFSDGEKQAKFRMGLTNFLARQYDSVQIPKEKFASDFETDPCYRFMGLMRDYIWTAKQEQNEPLISPDGLKPEEQPTEEEKSKTRMRHEVLSQAQWSICESLNGIGFAIKGGDNGEPHNHNDIGSFLYLAGEEQLICDLGAGEYTKEYFSEERYRILCNSSKGHSVPMINGSYQKAGKQYGASSFLADGKGTTILEFSGAYETDLIKKLVRKTEFSFTDGSLKVTDLFECRTSNPHLQMRGALSGSRGMLVSDGDKKPMSFSYDV